MPRFELYWIEDYYTYYVCILGISEELFWDADITFIENVALNRAAFDRFINYMHDR